MHEDGLEVHGDQDNAKMLVTRRKGFEQEQKQVKAKTGKKCRRVRYKGGI